jgi:hypothetical protein
MHNCTGVCVLQAVGDLGYCSMLDAHEHALGLGGGPQSRLGYAAGKLAGHLSSHPYPLFLLVAISSAMHAASGHNHNWAAGRKDALVYSLQQH